ncbi:CoA-transferase, partial [Roseomonas haemaphysalidis]|nr:succinyl-CoA--3-ketoacid-CoA transferase [Roseomonas haemaphysalidis]
VKKVVVLMEHTAGGKPKLLKACTLPLTGKAVVDVVITELAVFGIDRAQGRMTLVELAPGVTEAEIRDKTEADYETKLAVTA